MIKGLTFAVAVGLFAFAGCKSDDRSTRTQEAPVIEPAPVPAPPPESVGGGPTAEGASSWDREGAIDRLSHARCQARERCGAVGAMRDHTSYGECVEVSRADLRGSFGAATCQGYDEGKLDGCARKLADSACGSESSLSEDCVESKLCK
jgi:hypothetical protein